MPENHENRYQLRAAEKAFEWLWPPANRQWPRREER